MQVFKDVRGHGFTGSPLFLKRHVQRWVVSAVCKETGVSQVRGAQCPNPAAFYINSSWGLEPAGHAIWT